MPKPSRHDVFRATLIVAAILAAPAGAAVIRCTAPDGAVSYQEAECPVADKSHVMDLPTQYPAADPAERQRLFQREAELDKRLEAQRERDSRESVARAMQPPAQPIPAADDSAGYPLYWGAPLFQRNPPHRPIHSRPRVNPLDRRG